ncbi:amidohydrolase [Neobacillus sp. 179-C4.2 HS]|uniref:Amidohydrolase n=1 Tax=Neobacillus driksii TaxID=3035913 RepID=A0ABV4YUM4_9BACI|nr:amidohydrolase [Neobacillus sp. 179.-C4.2 HS]MDP5192676.1 amidohydrolase [Neobacillus sp. 179.-C4.2 HS]
MVKADIILSSNHVFTGVQDEPIKATIAIKDNKIIEIGPKEEIFSLMGDKTKVFDMEEELIIPGFHDFHMHIMMGSILQKDSAKLFDAASEEEVAEIIAKFAETRPNDEWIFGVGWDHTNWKKKVLPHRTTLDKYISDRPVLLFNAEVHYAWVNSKAIEMIQLTNDTPDPEYGEIGKDENGELTGLLFEHAIGYATEHAYKLPKQKRVQLFQDFLIETKRLGITSVNDLYGAKIAPNTLDDLEIFKEFDRKGLLTTRIHFSPELKMDLAEAKELRINYQSDKLTFSGLKQFIDGVVTSHTAFLLDPYKDRPETKGETTYPPDTIKQLVKKADKEKFQIRFHAIGNGAVRLALDAFEEARNENGERDARHVIEHVEVLHPDDVHRFRELNVIASFQPKHIELMESKAYTARINEDQKPLYYPIKTIVDTGAKIAFGTDFPVVPLNPMMGIYQAITRKDLNGKAWQKSEGVTLAQALKFYTATPAFGSFREKELGTLEVGKKADIVILNKNLFSISAEEILETEVKMTIMDGRVVYENQFVPSV